MGIDMRVIAGRARSLKLKTPEGLNTRPTTDRIKETLFNMLQPYLPEAVFIDLFSGSGGIGIEALSRGASHAYFVELNKDAVACILDNLKFTKFTEEATVLKQDALAALGSINEKEADVIFMDPPYGQEYDKRILERLKDMPYVTENTLIVTEALKDENYSYVQSMGYTIIKEKCYKTNKHVFLKKNQ